jgi:hypothetical protein
LFHEIAERIAAEIISAKLPPGARLPSEQQMATAMREIWPFYAVMFVVLMLVTYIPSISLWLPRTLSL